MDRRSLEYGRGQHGLADAMQYLARRLVARRNSAVKLASMEYRIEPPAFRYDLLNLHVRLSMGVRSRVEHCTWFADVLSLVGLLVQETHPGSSFQISNSSSAFQALAHLLLY
jgi:hypothetical protein